MAAGTLGDSLEPPTMEEVNEMMLRHRKPELDPSQLITPPGAQVRIHTSQEQFSDVNSRQNTQRSSQAATKENPIGDSK